MIRQWSYDVLIFKFEVRPRTSLYWFVAKFWFYNGGSIVPEIWEVSSLGWGEGFVGG